MHTAGGRQRSANTAALAAAGILVAAAMAPAVSPASGRGVAERALRLVADADSLLNIPANLFQDLANIPYDEVAGINELGDSLIFSGDWWTPSATNIWGEDPGDPGHFLGVFDTLIPFPQISGLGTPEPGAPGFDWADSADGHLGLGQQITLLADAEIPVSASSDSDWSAPLAPATEITGDTFVDRNIWFLAALTGLQQFPLFNQWFNIPLSTLESGNYNFGTRIDPSMGVGPDGSVPGDTTLGIAGTHPATPADIADLPPQDPAVASDGIHVDPAGEVVNGNGNPVNLMPWSNEPFTLNLLWPFQNFADSLQAPVDPGTYLQGFQFPGFDQLGHALQNLVAGSIIAFDPDVPGNPFCGSGCTDGALSIESLVKDVNSLVPGNTSLADWLELAGQPGLGPFGMANGSTDHDVDFMHSVFSSSQQQFDFGNPSPQNPPTTVDTPEPFQISPGMQNLIAFMHDSGAQSFVRDVASLFGYQPTDYDNLPGSFADTISAPTAAAGMLSDLSGEAGFLEGGLENILTFGAL